MKKSGRRIERAGGKRQRVSIALRAREEGEGVELELSDDGTGWKPAPGEAAPAAWAEAARISPGWGKVWSVRVSSFFLYREVGQWG